MNIFGFKQCLVILFILFSLFSCTLRSSGVSIDEQLSQVDSLIEVGDYDGARSFLKRIAKTIRNPSETIGVVRRALILQEDDLAKSQLLSALEKTPDNLELLAVYTHMLMAEESYTDALPYAQKLEGTQYGSLYSELRFTMDDLHLQEVNSDKADNEKLEEINYYSESYVQAYIDIYNSTGDAAYLRNASLVYALQGNIVKASSFHPVVLSSYENPLFWALISYDAHKFDQVVVDLQLFEPTSDDLALLADAYVQLDSIEEARHIWLASTQEFSLENPIAWHNTALYYQSMGEIKMANDVILYLVDAFPDYVGGLAAYGRFSLLDSNIAEQTVFTPLLESKGIETLQMEKNSHIAVLDTQDAVKRMDEAIEGLLPENESRAMELTIERLKLMWNASENLVSRRDMVSDLWKVLEANVQDPYGYNDVLVQYAVWFFFTQGMIDEADALFTTHCTTRYASYYEQMGQYSRLPLDDMTTWEYEYGGYLALNQERYDDAQKWLLKLMPNNNVSPTTPIEASFNVTTLYNATGKRALALSVYEQMLQYVKDVNLLADIHYRMALIYSEMGDTKKASISLNEALLLDFNHSASRLLLKKING